MIVVIDTNVPIVANGKSEQASPGCVKLCVISLRELMEKGKLVLDNQWHIIKEYRNKLHSSGQPGVGDAFLEWVLRNRCNPKRCELVDITLDDSDTTNFKEFPSDKRMVDFHYRDRKFIAVSLSHPRNPTIWQAVDAKWWNFRNILAENGVKVEFLCKSDIKRILNK
ncbi:MAG: hypothetical protein Q8O92_09610 [Candidatus Latescibacter sp.]|nr:hypothetical protein [Candidatus Latescibacter sp.]